MKTEWQKQIKTGHIVKVLTESEIQDLLVSLPHWQMQNENGITKLVREIIFTDFIHAFAFLSKIAMISQMLDHHAEIFNVYNKVKISLYTHTHTKITNLDQIFAHNAENMI